MPPKKRKDSLLETTTTSVESKEKKRRKKLIDLPGAVAIVNNGPGAANSCFITVPEQVTKKIRRYTDLLYGTIAYEQLSRLRNDTANSTHILTLVPNTVRAILDYNNIRFAGILLKLTTVEIPEILWYDIDYPNKVLYLYASKTMFENFCTLNNNYDVMMETGFVPLEAYNPFSSPKEVKITPALVKCAVMCDHLAQHVIDDIYRNSCSMDERSVISGNGCTLHYNWTRHGITLHSIFSITRHGTRTQSMRDTLSYSTVIGLSDESKRLTDIVPFTNVFENTVLPALDGSGIGPNNIIDGSLIDTSSPQLADLVDLANSAAAAAPREEDNLSGRLANIANTFASTINGLTGGASSSSSGANITNNNEDAATTTSGYRFIY